MLKNDLESFYITTVLTRGVCVMFEKMSQDSPEIIKHYAGASSALAYSFSYCVLMKAVLERVICV